MTKEESKEFVKLHGFWFVKTIKHVSTEEELNNRENLIFEENSPTEMIGIAKVCPLAQEDFPTVLQRMTAMDAGNWAVEKCHQQGWEVNKDNIGACLCNLEIDY